MVAMTDVYVTIDAPALVPASYGLFSVAPASAPADPHWALGVRWLAGAGCVQAHPTIDECITGTTPGALLLDDSYCNWYGTKPFSVYVLGHRSGPRSVDVAEAEISGALQAAEERAVEERLWQELTAATPGGTVSAYSTALEALAHVQWWLGQLYNGRGVVHMSRFTATLLSAHLFPLGSQLQTRLGTPVVAGAGYDTADVPTTQTILGTGAVVVNRGTIDTSAQGMNREINDYTVLAQRPYAVGWDCTVVKATVS